MLCGIALTTALQAAEPRPPGMRQQPMDRSAGMRPPPTDRQSSGGMREQPLIQEVPGLNSAIPARPQAEPHAFSRPEASAPRSRWPIEEDRRRTESRSMTYRGTRYVINDGRWFEQRGGELVATAPPAGMLVEELPRGYSMRWVGGVPYFYSEGVYYVWRERSRRYEILQAPPEGQASPEGKSAPAGESRLEPDRDTAGTP